MDIIHVQYTHMFRHVKVDMGVAQKPHYYAILHKKAGTCTKSGK
jgi:hypothetical protein